MARKAPNLAQAPKRDLLVDMRERSISLSAEKMRELLRAWTEPAPPAEKKKKKKKTRAPGAGRPPALTQEEVERGIRLLFSGKVLLMKQPVSPKRAFALLREAGIGVNVSDLTLRRRILNVAGERLRAALRSKPPV